MGYIWLGGSNLSPQPSSSFLETNPCFCDSVEPLHFGTPEHRKQLCQQWSERRWHKDPLVLPYGTPAAISFVVKTQRQLVLLQFHSAEKRCLECRWNKNGCVCQVGNWLASPVSPGGLEFKDLCKAVVKLQVTSPFEGQEPGMLHTCSSGFWVIVGCYGKVAEASLFSRPRNHWVLDLGCRGGCPGEDLLFVPAPKWTQPGPEKRESVYFFCSVAEDLKELWILS